MSGQSILFLTAITSGVLWIWWILYKHPKALIARRLPVRQSSKVKIGLFYRLQNGTDLFIGQSQHTELINSIMSDLERKSPTANSLINYTVFERLCAERFNPYSLHAEIIEKQGNYYPMYRNTGIIWRESLI